mgnify:CR=1 FL=1
MHRKEKKMRENHGKKGIIYAENLVKALLCAYLVTGMFLLILALLLYKAGLSEENVNLGIILIYVIGTFSGGFVMGKLEGQKKFLWGLGTGVVYFVLLLIISFGMYREVSSGGRRFVSDICTLYRRWNAWRDGRMKKNPTDV